MILQNNLLLVYCSLCFATLVNSVADNSVMSCLRVVSYFSLLCGYIGWVKKLHICQYAMHANLAKNFLHHLNCVGTLPEKSNSTRMTSNVTDLTR